MPKEKPPAVDKGSVLGALPVYERRTSGEYFETELADRWPEFWWGFPGFARERLGMERPDVPLAPFRTESGSEALRAEVSTYLDAAPMAVVGMVPEQKCEFCDAMIHIASQQSDGVWLWPSDLGHRVAEHGFYVPNRFVDHIRAQGHPPADLLGVDIEGLPWPKRSG